MNFTPVHDQVLIKRTAGTNTTASGLIIPGGTGEKPDEGTVIKVGPGRMLESGAIRTPVVSEGEVVLFEKYGGIEIKIGADEYMVVRDEKILGTLQ